MRSFLFVIALITSPAHAQWEMQDSGTTASLRGIDNVGDGVAWASGTGGTVLRTVDGGKHWEHCAVPPDADKLDFRGVQAFDAKTAIVMSSGKGELSRLYKTVDGCATWKLLFTNPDEDGFWDALIASPGRAFLIGDPVKARFVIFACTDNALERWERFGEKTNIMHFPYDPAPKEALFAASNSNIEGNPHSYLAFITGGESGAKFYLGLWNEAAPIGRIGAGYFEAKLPLAKGAGAGAFSLGGTKKISEGRHYVVVGGDYTKADNASGIATYSTDGGKRWKFSQTQPHGYRSAVAYDATTKTWITVGPNGTDISTDDGRNWRALTPAAGDSFDADMNWNALSLPFVVGPKGRIGVLRTGAR